MHAHGKAVETHTNSHNKMESMVSKFTSNNKLNKAFGVVGNVNQMPIKCQ